VDSRNIGPSQGWDGQQPAAWNGGRPPGGQPGQGWNGGGQPAPGWNGGAPPEGQPSPERNGRAPSEGPQPAGWNGPPPDAPDDPNAGDPGGAPRRSRPSLRLPAIKGRARLAQGEKGPGALPPAAYFFAAGVVLVVALIAVAGVVVLLHDEPKTSAPQSGGPLAGGPLPSVYSAAASTDVFAPIAKRTADPSPLTANEVFDKKTIADQDSKASLTLTTSKLDARCADTVWGQALVRLLQQAGCTQVARGVYADKRFMAMEAIFNLADSTVAAKLVTAADPRTGNGFARPPSAEAAFGRGFSTARGVAMGHYAVITWVRRVDGSGSETDPKLLSLLVTVGPPPAIVGRVAGQGEKN
jgi:hypothetical protein